MAALRFQAKTSAGSLERETRLELATSTLGRSRSTQFLAHRPDDHDQFRDARGSPLDLGGVEDLDGGGLVQPDPAAIPGLEVELLAQAGLDHE